MGLRRLAGMDGYTRCGSCERESGVVRKRVGTGRTATDHRRTGKTAFV